ncbi:hypothetical protein PSQ19_17235 [Devosia algicola]|uniref:Uncharacterized protein n=1 Tax=Devosia algicola TaxID=3026418 RepID=A0ABY7YMA6_9HYPH|nr:hypothetical protein [Devosia algicola]WDR02342.1 hypothetical protein PSQ19_17235 [Devosia algicola]
MLNTMVLGGLDAKRCEAAAFGGSVYAELSPATEKTTLSKQSVASAIATATRYIENGQASCDLLRDFCQRALADNRKLGVYVPARFVNSMRIIGIPFNGVRFFDDDPSLVGTFYPGIPIAIESRSSLIEDPVDTLIIMSRTFGGALKKVLLDVLPVGIEIMLISDLADIDPQSAAND